MQQGAPLHPAIPHSHHAAAIFSRAAASERKGERGQNRRKELGSRAEGNTLRKLRQDSRAVVQAVPEGPGAPKAGCQGVGKGSM